MLRVCRSGRDWGGISGFVSLYLLPRGYATGFGRIENGTGMLDLMFAEEDLVRIGNITCSFSSYFVQSHLLSR